VTVSVTVLAGWATYPLNTVIRRMMVTSGNSEKYFGGIHCFFSVLKHEGIGALFSGLLANTCLSILSAILLSGINNLVQQHSLEGDT